MNVATVVSSGNVLTIKNIGTGTSQVSNRKVNHRNWTSSVVSNYGYLQKLLIEFRAHCEA